MPNVQSLYPSSGSSEQASLKNWRILIVDDQHDNLTLAGAVLAHRGAVVELVNNARTVLSLIKEFQPTVILLDLAMPDMDGWQLVKAIRANKSTQDLPVIALTVRVSVDDHQRAFEAGFDGYIPKPYSVNGIVAQLHEILANLPARQA